MRIFILAFFLSAFYTIHAQYEFDGTCKDLSHIIEMEQHHHEQSIHFRSNELTSNYDINFHRMEWEINPAENYIRGAVTTYFQPIQLDFQQLNFDFAENMTVNAVVYHGDTLPYLFSGNDNLQIGLPNIIGIGEQDSVTVHYEGAPNSTGFGSFEQSSHQGVPILWTLSEPYGAKVWWPCKQDLVDKIDSTDIIVRTPLDYRVASNGTLTSEVEDGDEKVYTWKHRYPIPAYLVAIAVTNYSVFSDYVELSDGDSVEVLNYVFPEDHNFAVNQLGNTVEIMELFNELFGDYPFADEKYGHAQFGWGGGMEHQTMSFMGGFSYGLQAHELAHQWFGDKVTCGSWEDIWLNEGFATYLTGLTAEFYGSPGDWYNWKSGRINSITSQPHGSVWVDDTTNVSRIFSGRLSYNKGAMLLHMLRWKLGDDNFFEGAKNYLNDPALAFGYAKTKDLQTHLEMQSGQDLAEFFNDWFYGQGYPSYHINWTNLGDKVRIGLEQTTSHPSVDFFEMPLPILVQGNGQDSLLRLEHAYSGVEFIIELPFEVEEIRFDPDLWLISKENTVEEVFVNAVENKRFENSITIAPNPIDEVLYIRTGQTYSIDHIEIFNADGHLMKMVMPEAIETQIDSATWPIGTYFIHLKSGGLIAVKQVVKR